MSSPTYDDQFSEPIQDALDLEAFHDDSPQAAGDLSHLKRKSLPDNTRANSGPSRSQPVSPHSPRSSVVEGRPLTPHTPTELTSPRNRSPLTSSPLHRTLAPGASGSSPGPSQLPRPRNSFLSGFASAAKFASSFHGVETTYRSPSPEEPTEQDYSHWFESDHSLPVAFQAARSIVSSSADDPDNLSLAFTTASHKTVLEPSAVALRQAEERIKQWQQDGPDLDDTASTSLTSSKSTTGDSIATERSILRSLDNTALSAKVPSTFGAAGHAPETPVRAAIGMPSGFSSPLIATDLKGKTIPKPFRSPLTTQATPRAQPTHTDSFPPPPSQAGFLPAIAHHILGTTPAASSPLSKAPFSTPIRRRAADPHRPKPFVTPFKNGVRPVPQDKGRRVPYPTATPSKTLLTPATLNLGTPVRNVPAKCKVSRLSIPSNELTEAFFSQTSQD